VNANAPGAAMIIRAAAIRCMDPPVLLSAAYDAFNQLYAPVGGRAAVCVCDQMRWLLVVTRQSVDRSFR